MFYILIQTNKNLSIKNQGGLILHAIIVFFFRGGGMFTLLTMRNM